MADIVNLNFTADADFSPFISEVNRAMAQLSKFRNTSLANNLNLNKKDFDAAVLNFRDLVTATGHFSSEVVNVTSSTEKFGRSLARQNLKLKEYYQAYAEYRKQATGQIRMLAQEQVRISQSVVKSLGRDMSGAQKALVITPTGIDAIGNAAKISAQETMIFNKVLRDGATSLINWGKNTQWAGRQLTVGLTLPIMLFGKQAAEAFRMADQELTRLAKVYGGIGATSSAELETVRKNVSELSRTLASTYGASFQETLALAADIAATGAEGNDLLAATAETTRLATLGEVDRQEAMKATLALQSAFKLNTDELSQSINFLNAVENQTSTTLQDLVEAIPKAGPVIKGLGGSVKDLALFLTAMREGGINAAEGANALKSGLASLINPTKQAVEKLGSFGINIEDIVTSNAGDLVGLIMDLQKALDKLDPLQKQQAIEQLFGKYQFARLGALLNNIGREGSQSLQVLDLMQASTEDLAATADRELAALTGSASGRYKRALEEFKATLAEFGEPFLAIFTNILKVGSAAIEMIQKIPAPLKALLTGLAGLTALAGPMIMLTGLMGNFIGYIIKGIASFRQLRSGAGAFELITTATVAADQVADAYTQSTFNQAQAADVLRASLEKLAMAYRDVASAAAGGAPPPGGYPGTPGALGPQGPVVPTGGPSASGGAMQTSKSVAAFEELYTGMQPAAAKARERLAAEMAGLSGKDLDDFLEKKLMETQQLYETKGVGRKRGSAAIAPAVAAVLSGRGMLGPGGKVTGLYKPGIDDDLTFYGAEYAHLFPELKAQSKNPATGILPMSPDLNTAIGDRPGQSNLLTPEGKMAAIEAGYIVEEQLRSGITPNQLVMPASKGGKFGGVYKDAVRGFFGRREVNRDVVDAALAGKYEDAIAGRQVETSIPVPVSGENVSTAGNVKVQRTKSGRLQVRGADGKLISQQSAEAKAAIAEFTKVEESAKSIENNTKKTNTNLRQSARSAARFAGIIGGSVGTLGMVSSMILSMTGSTNQMAMNIANFAMAAGFAVPAIQGLGAGLRTVGGSLSKSAGMVGMLGRGLAFLGSGPGMLAIATVTALALGIKKLNDMYKESIAKAKADISVSEEALNAFGGSAISAASKFKSYVDTSKALAQELINQREAAGVPGLPTEEEIAKVEEQVNKLYQDQIKRAKDINTKEQAIEFARNLKSTLVAQNVDPKTASTIIASIMKQAGKDVMSIPVLLDIAGITNKDQAMDQLMSAADKTFKDISEKLAGGGSVSRALGERFSEQLDLLSASAISQVKTFEDLGSVINYLPEGMKGLTFESLNATTAGRSLLASIQATNPELYDAWQRAGDLAGAIQMAAANSMGLTSALEGVAGQFDIAAQNAMNVVAAQAYQDSGLQKYYSNLVKGEQNAIANLKKRMKSEMNAADAKKEKLDEQIDKERKIIDSIKEQASARKDALRVQQDAADFESDINKLRLEQKAALLTGNLAEAAMVEIDIEKKMRDRSVDLAERAIDEKADKEVKLHERKMELLEAEKKAIKDLTDEQKKAIEERYNALIKKHNDAIAKYRQDASTSAATFRKLFEEAAGGSLKAYQQLEELLGKTGNKINVLGTSFQAFMTKTMEAFSKSFGDSLAALLGPDYRVQNGKIQQSYQTPGPKGRGTVTRWKDVSTIAEMFGIKGGGVEIDPNRISTGTSGIVTGPNSVDTMYGKFNIKKDPQGRQYVEYYHKLFNKNEKVYMTDKNAIESELVRRMIGRSDITPLAMGGMAKKNYMIKAQAFNGINTEKSAFPYLVGEKGPELFIPNMNGNVVPADRLYNAVRTMTNSSSMGSNCEYNINVSVINPGATADQIASAIEDKMRLMNSRVGISRSSGGNY